MLLVLLLIGLIVAVAIFTAGVMIGHRAERSRRGGLEFDTPAARRAIKTVTGVPPELVDRARERRQ